jgi:hypothetical protein
LTCGRNAAEIFEYFFQSIKIMMLEYHFLCLGLA